MPRGWPSVGPSSSGSVYIGFFSGALRSHSRRSTGVEALGGDALEVAAPRTPPAAASHTTVAARRGEQVERRPGERVARHQVGQVGRRPGVHVVLGVGDHRVAVGVDQAVDLVAARALRDEHRLALGGQGARPPAPRTSASWLAFHVSKSSAVEGDDLHPHVGVRQPAELGALAGVDPRLVGLQAQRLDAPGHHVALAVEPRDPEAVDHVAARAAHQHVGVRSG